MKLAFPFAPARAQIIRISIVVRYVVVFRAVPCGMYWGDIERTGPDRTKASVKFYLNLINTFRHTQTHMHTLSVSITQNVRLFIWFTVMIILSLMSYHCCCRARTGSFSLSLECACASVCVCVWMLYASARTSQHKTALQFSVVSWILKRQQSDWLYENETRNVTCTVKEDYGCRQSAFAIVEEFYTTKTTLFSNHAIHTRSGPIFHFLCRFMQNQRIGRRIIFLCWCIPKCSDWSDQQPTWVRKI